MHDFKPPAMPEVSDNMKFLKLLGHRNELDADRLPNLDAASRRGQTSGVLIDAKDNHVARILVGGQQIVPGRVDSETARRFALSGNVFDMLDLSRRRVSREHNDAVVAAVRAVKKLSRRM